ncbi:SHOCT domain-containing protein [Streptomyces sp. A0642]|uniref:SHOCT domain-containing protein n=1 Tax=Streptomyces sp. A0642 TaxID=2563100 RepID=UPI0010A20F2B|nr:SHOCT domain-containing protein [Streptomyces sp. A0642]THA75848.1 SHOCT domain-containing protein [Streptomyces sp. A0642]
MNRGGPGLLGSVACTAVVAGTASAVSGRVQRRQQARFAEDDAERMADEQMRRQAQGGRQQAAGGRSAEPPVDDVISRLERLAELKNQGILTSAEFEAQKAKLLAD